MWATDENGIVWENATVNAITARGFTWGEEYYGNFGRALYTLFQVQSLPITSRDPQFSRPVTGTIQEIHICCSPNRC